MLWLVGHEHLAMVSKKKSPPRIVETLGVRATETQFLFHLLTDIDILAKFSPVHLLKLHIIL